MNPIIEKLKKLLRMKRGGTVEEIATAICLARKLAEKHGIDLESIDPDETSNTNINHEAVTLGSRIQCECKYAALICQTFFSVEAFQSLNYSLKRELIFVGAETDRKIAIYVYHFLVAHFRRQWNHHSGRLRNRQSFMWGMFIGLRNKLHDQQPKEVNSPGLIRLNQSLQLRKDYVSTNFGKMESKSVAPDSDSSVAKYRGWLAGRATNINPAVQPSQSRLQLTSVP